MSETTNKQSETKTRQSNTAPHRIVNWVAMQNTVNPALGKCSKCKEKGMKLVEVSRTSLASTFDLECETCKQNKNCLQNHIYYLQEEYKWEKSRKKYVDIANQKAKLKK